jgi:hypothetical protein
MIYGRLERIPQRGDSKFVVLAKQYEGDQIENRVMYVKGMRAKRGLE